MYVYRYDELETLLESTIWSYMKVTGRHVIVPAVIVYLNFLLFFDYLVG